MMTDDFSVLLDQARRWIGQEACWDRQLYATATPPTSPRPAQSEGMSTPKALPGAMAPGPVTEEATTDKAVALNSLYEEYKNCTRCPLGPTRIKFVFGVGSPNAQVMFIGEGPGYEEDRRGEPFIGKAGQLLDKILASIGLSRQTNAYIANIVKCHPMANPLTPEARGNDRPPTPDEVQTCSPILLRQIAVIRPRIIVTLGSPSTRMMLKSKEGITQLRGKFFPFDVEGFYPASEGATLAGVETPNTGLTAWELSPETRAQLRHIRVLPTFHPAALLRNPNLKPETWSDMKLLRDTLVGVPKEPSTVTAP